MNTQEFEMVAAIVAKFQKSQDFARAGAIGIGNALRNVSPMFLSDDNADILTKAASILERAATAAGTFQAKEYARSQVGVSTPKQNFTGEELI